MPFITKSNSLKIIGKIDFNKTIGIKGALYKKPIPFFSQYEKNKLLGLKAFFENPDNFISEFYVPIPKIDLQKFVYEGSSPAYHIRSNCERLNSDFKNFEITEEIRNRGNGEVDRFRKWFKSNLHLIDNLDIFTLLLNKEFKVNTSPQSIEFNNSGLEIKEDINLEELEERIDEYLKKEDLYTNQSSLEKKEIIARYQQHTFLAYSNNKIKNNNTRFSDKSIKEFLKQYDIHFKRPVYELITEYYRVKHNPDLKFEGMLLNQLGFKPCATCYEKYIEVEDVII